MYTCKNCGAQLTDEARHCPSCGAVREAASKSGDFSAKVAQLNNTADTTNAFDRNDITANNFTGSHGEWKQESCGHRTRSYTT